VACSPYGEIGNLYKILIEKPEENRSEDPGVDGRIILK
jgi:hypothetical protein